MEITKSASGDECKEIDAKCLRWLNLEVNVRQFKGSVEFPYERKPHELPSHVRSDLNALKYVNRPHVSARMHNEITIKSEKKIYCTIVLTSVNGNRRNSSVPTTCWKFCSAYLWDLVWSSLHEWASVKEINWMRKSGIDIYAGTTLIYAKAFMYDMMYIRRTNESQWNKLDLFQVCRFSCTNSLASILFNGVLASEKNDPNWIPPTKSINENCEGIEIR